MAKSLFAAVVLALSAAASASRKLVELAPSKAVMLMKVWQARENMANVMTTVPDGRKLKVVRASAGEEMTRRTRCKEQFATFLDRSPELATRVTVPSVYRQASATRVLTLERLYGVPLTDLDSVRVPCLKPALLDQRLCATHV